MYLILALTRLNWRCNKVNAYVWTFWSLYNMLIGHRNVRRRLLLPKRTITWSIVCLLHRTLNRLLLYNCAKTGTIPIIFKNVIRGDKSKSTTVHWFSTSNWTLFKRSVKINVNEMLFKYWGTKISINHNFPEEAVWVTEYFQRLHRWLASFPSAILFFMLQVRRIFEMLFLLLSYPRDIWTLVSLIRLQLPTKLQRLELSL